jgi:hypothetical protein
MTLDRKTGGREAETPNHVTADIRALAQRHAADALAVLVDLMRNAERDETKLAAANSLLDRAYGKKIQAIDADVNNITNNPDQYRDHRRAARCGVDEFVCAG